MNFQAFYLCTVKAYIRLNQIYLCWQWSLKAIFVFANFFIGLTQISSQDLQKEDARFREIFLCVDNDAFLFSRTHDKYYTNGIFAGYRQELRKGHFLFNPLNRENIHHALLQIQLFHLLYTPEKIFTSEEELMDRPYAGWLGATIGIEYQLQESHSFSIDFDLGWMGPSTQSDKLHIWLHDIFNLKAPRGWAFQIEDTFAADLRLEYRPILLRRGFARLSGLGGIQVGSIRQNARAGLGFRFGSINFLSEPPSTVVDSREDGIRISAPKHGLSFFSNHTVEHVFYNGTIEGNLFNRETGRMRQAKKLVFHQEYGVARYGRKISGSLSLILRSPEVLNGKGHLYMSIKLSHRI